MNKKYFLLLCIGAGGLLLGSCKKFVDIGAPRNSLSTELMFTDSASAASAVQGIYSKIMGVSVNPSFGCGSATLNAGQSADELSPGNTGDQAFYLNALVQDNSSVKSMWTDAYSYIYQANLCIEGMDASKTLPAAIKNPLQAEARLIRSFFYFYLVNLYGDVPYVTTSDWNTSFGHGRTPAATIYEGIIKDLEIAQNELPATYPAAGKIRPVKWAATALLARVYLYTQQWAKAEAAATAVINSGAYPALPAPANAFLKNSDEAIWQLLPINSFYNTLEGYVLTGTGFTLQTPLVQAFEANDLRFSNWVKTTGTPANPIYSVNKYKVRTTVNGVVSEYYTLLRLGEQYLIRAEARNNQKNAAGAVSDLNVIRQRAGLLPLSTSLTQDACVKAIEQERRIELFSEWGHRWLDLKRTDRANAVLAPIKSKWTPNAVWYPIPLSERMTDPALGQNNGY